MMFGRADRFSRLFGRPRSQGNATVACAAALPLVVLAFAVATDYANVSRFRTHIQSAADAASLAAAEVVARQPDRSGDLASQVATGVFAHDAPQSATGKPTVEVQNRAAVVTANVGYTGVAPSNFGSALGYNAIRVDASATSFTPIADFRSPSAR